MTILIILALLLVAFILWEALSAIQRAVRRERPIRRAYHYYDCDTTLDDYWKDSSSQRGKYGRIPGRDAAQK